MEAKTQPLISVLMTSYNREKYIEQAIKSVLQSSYKNFELIIVDDGSMDRTVEIAKAYEAKDSRINVYINEKNLGDYPNRNKAASYAKGKYIKYLDSDDAIYPWGLKAVVTMMENNPEADYGLDSIEQDDEKIYPYLLTPSETYLGVYQNRKPYFSKAPTSCIIKLEVFKEVGGFLNVRNVGDVELWHRLSLKFKLLVMPHGIIWSRDSPDSESRKNLVKALFIWYPVYFSNEYMNKKETPLPYNIKKKVIKRNNFIIAKILIKARLKGDKSLKDIEVIKEYNLISLFLKIFFY